MPSTGKHKPAGSGLAIVEAKAHSCVPCGLQCLRHMRRLDCAKHNTRLCPLCQAPCVRACPSGIKPGCSDATRQPRLPNAVRGAYRRCCTPPGPLQLTGLWCARARGRLEAACHVAPRPLTAKAKQNITRSRHAHRRLTLVSEDPDL